MGTAAPIFIGIVVGISAPSSGLFPSHTSGSRSLPQSPTPTTWKDHSLQKQSLSSRVLVYLQKSTTPAGGPIVQCLPSPTPWDSSAHSVLAQAGGRSGPVSISVTQLGQRLPAYCEKRRKGQPGAPNSLAGFSRPQMATNTSLGPLAHSASHENTYTYHKPVSRARRHTHISHENTYPTLLTYTPHVCLTCAHTRARTRTDPQQCLGSSEKLCTQSSTR